MARLRFYFRFNVANMIVQRATLARELVTDIDGQRVALRITADPAVFPPAGRGERDAAPDAPAPDGAAWLSVLQVSVDDLTDYGLQDFNTVDSYGEAHRFPRDFYQRVWPDFERNLGVARRLVSAVVAHARIDLKQPALPLPGDGPPLLDFQRILDVYAGAFLPLAMGAPAEATFTPAGWDPVAADGDWLERLLQGDWLREEPLAEATLTDAQHFGRRQPPDRSRAVLMAAIATEVKVKEVLRAVAKPEASAMVEVLLDNPRDFSMSVESLFDKVMLAANGRSLRVDDRALYKKVGALFVTRNRLAHTGCAPSQEEASAGLGAAEGAFAWLDSLAATSP